MSLEELVYKSITAKQPVESPKQIPVRSTTISQFAIALEYNPRSSKSSFMNYYALVKPHSVLPNGLTMLVTAIVDLDLDFLKTLLDYGTDVNVKDQRGYNALMVAVDESIERKPNPVYREVAKMLIDAGTDLGAVDNSGWTVLHHLAGRAINGWDFRKESDDYETRCQLARNYNEERMNMVELLISNGADIFAENGDIPTPYDVAEEWGDEYFIELYWF